MYPACFYKEKDGQYSVIFPDLGTSTCGSTLDEAMKMAIDCLAGFLYDARREHEEVQPPSALSDVDPDSLYDEYESAFVNMVAVDVDEYARTHFERSVKKTLTISAWLNDMAVAQGINFSRTLQNALKTELHLV